MYYSSESSEVEEDSNVLSLSLDFSYLMMDTESIGVHLRNSIREQKVKLGPSQRYPLTSSSLSRRENDDQESASTAGVSSIDSGTRSRASEYPAEGDAVEIEVDVESVEDKLVSLSLHDDDPEEDLIDTVTNRLFLQHNMLLTLPFEVAKYSKLKSLDLSNNSLTHINDFLLQLPELQSLYLKNNSLGDDSLPKDLPILTRLRELNISGNSFTRIPNQMYEMNNLRYLYLGNNQITEIYPEVKAMQGLYVLHLGGNLLETVPHELGELQQLQALVLCENRLQSLPRSIANLTRLKSLLLHKNNLCCLPVGIVKLRGLLELSLRDNPLVTKFVNSCARELMYNSPSLLELAARVIKLKKLHYTEEDLPKSLIMYLSSGHRCVNPKCKGMYFTSCIEHIKLVDFCGMYRVPLMHYLCSSRCSSKTPTYYRASSSESESDDEQPSARLKRVLLG
ncbi:Leucine-rich repeat-containing protein 58 [Halocaridina rubra]|uniref:Leucine-rich repeat-containing protein 58 n=1 Tax=Halocaridina rubra TaxID=373956 RepID=A0AAN9AFU0_HALRR